MNHLWRQPRSIVRIMTIKKEEKRRPKPLKILVIIAIMALSGYILMIWISPESKNLSAFLAGFAVLFCLIVVISWYIQYVYQLFSDIKKRNEK